MRSELSFLMELFLSDEVPKPIKAMVADRIREVEESLITRPVSNVRPPVALPTEIAAQQAPSMQRIMERNADLVPPAPASPAAAQALAARAAIIQRGINTDKPEPGRTSPRKF